LAMPEKTVTIELIKLAQSTAKITGITILLHPLFLTQRFAPISLLLRHNIYTLWQYCIRDTILSNEDNIVKKDNY
jgi:hypothetical protein